MARLSCLSPLRIALGVALAGCAPASARPIDADLGAVPASAARVCVVRPAPLAGRVTMELRDNARLVGATRGRTYVCWLAAPGDHQITSIDDDTGPTFLGARAGAHYWLHQDVTTLAGDLHAHLDWVDDATAESMLDQCDARVKVAIPGHEDRDDGVAVTPRL